MEVVFTYCRNDDKMKNKKYRTIRTVPHSNQKLVYTEAKSIPLTQNDRSISWQVQILQ